MIDGPGTDAGYAPCSDAGEDRVAAVLNPLPHVDAVAISLDHQAVIRDANPAAARILGMPREALIGCSWIDRFLPEATRATARERLSAFLGDTPVSRSVVQEIVDATGRHHVLAWLVSPLRDSSGTVVGVLAIGDPEGAADYVQAESAAQLQALIDTTRVGIVFVAADPASGQRIIRRANQRVADILGYGHPTNLVGRPVDVTHASQEAADSFGRRYFDALSRREQLHIEYQLRHKDGHLVWCLLSGKAIDTSVPADLTKGVIWVVDDISSRKAMETALVRARDAAEAASHAKSRFLASMSHELRTPLNAIIGFSEIMDSRMFGPLPDRYAEYASLIHRSGRHLVAVINQILDLAKIEAGKVDLVLARHYMGEVVADVLDLLGASAAAKGLYLRDETDCLHELHFDRVRIRQALVNIVGNALKFTHTGGVTIRNACADGWHGIEVEDTGPGMTAEEVRVALEPFGQVEGDGLVRGAEGTGLGLSLSREILRMHDGHLDVSSRKGVGTTVTLRLPEDLHRRRRSAKEDILGP